MMQLSSRRLKRILGAFLCVLAFAGISWSGDLPDSGLTPGDTVGYDVATMCRPDFLTAVNPRPPIPVKMQREIFAAYGVPWADRSGYELDHLVMRGLNGADTKANLWPQSYSGTWNARVKDQLEQKLRKLVCADKLTLGEAQEAIRRDWIAAFRKYVGK